MSDGSSGTNTGWTGNMLVYNTGTGIFSVGNGIVATLVGAPPDSAYNGILFFEDRTAASATHQFSGGSGFAWSGTIYLTSTLAAMNAGVYQTMNCDNGGATTVPVNGSIITSNLIVTGDCHLRLQVTSTWLPSVRQVALVR